MDCMQLSPSLPRALQVTIRVRYICLCNYSTCFSSQTNLGLYWAGSAGQAHSTTQQLPHAHLSSLGRAKANELLRKNNVYELETFELLRKTNSS